MKNKSTGTNGNGFFISRELNGLSPRSARAFLSGRIARVINGSARSIAHSSTHTFGWLFLSFGLLSLFLQLAEYYFRDITSVPLSSLIIGAVFAVLAIPLLLVDQPMCQAVQDFPLTDFILYEFFCIKRMRLDENVKAIKPVFGVIVGLILGVIGFVFPLDSVVLVLVILLLAVTAFISPEFPFLLTLLLLPYLSMLPYSSEILAILSAATLLSFFRKMLLGKRVYCFENYDVLILLFMALFTVGGVIGGGEASTGNSLIMISLVLGYIPAANIVVNRRLADCAVNAIIVSAFPVAVGAAAEYSVNLAAGNRTPAKSIMQTPETLAAFLTVATVLTLFYGIAKTKGYKRAPYFFTLAVEMLALISTENIFILPVIIFGAIAYAILRSKRIPSELVLLCIVCPYLFYLLPDGALGFISERFGLVPALSERITKFSSDFSVFSDNLLFGIGAGNLSEGGAGYLNMPFGLALRFGVFAIILFLAFVFLRHWHLSAYATYYRSSAVHEVTVMTSLASVCLLVFGSFYDVFADMSVFYLFWCVMGLCSATLRVAKNEHDDRVGYYSDQSSFDASDASISLSREV